MRKKGLCNTLKILTEALDGIQSPIYEYMEKISLKKYHSHSWMEMDSRKNNVHKCKMVDIGGNLLSFVQH